jgi:hypothetical protein
VLDLDRYPELAEVLDAKPGAVIWLQAQDMPPCTLIPGWP